jgi:hypothetical protein
VGIFSSFAVASVPACVQGNSKCAKLEIAKTGFSNPKKREGKILNSFPEKCLWKKKSILPFFTLV